MFSAFFFFFLGGCGSVDSRGKVGNGANGRIGGNSRKQQHLHF